MTDVWGAIGKDCFCALVSPREIWEGNEQAIDINLSIAQNKQEFDGPNENSYSGYFDESQKGIFVKWNVYKQKSSQSPIRNIISGSDSYSLTGNIFGDVDLERIKNQNQPEDAFFFLPCSLDKHP